MDNFTLPPSVRAIIIDDIIARMELEFRDHWSHPRRDSGVFLMPLSAKHSFHPEDNSSRLTFSQSYVKFENAVKNG